jgi:PTS system mannose-specific IIC component
MTLLKFLLLGIIYYIGNSTSFTLGIGYFTLYRPVFSGLLTGIILGDPVTGFLSGAIINIFFIGFKSTGGSLKGGDPCLAGIVGAMIAVNFNIQGVGALAVAYPVSAVGILFWKYRLNLNSYYVKEGIRGLKKGDLNSINQYDIPY